MNNKHSYLLKLTALYIFFSPFLSIAIPGIFVGANVTPARFFMGLILSIMFTKVCINHLFLNNYFSKRAGYYNNPYIRLLLIYFFTSLLFYYSLLLFDKVALYGSMDFLTRNWMGRPVAQLLSFMAFGIIPFYLVRKYAINPSSREILEKTFIAAIVVLLYYGIFQQISFFLGLPVTGRDIYEGAVPTYSTSWGPLLRFYSFGGEPRDFGTFIIGATLFYYYFNLGKLTLVRKINIFLMLVAFFLSSSSTAYLVFFISLIIIIFDLIYQQQVRIKQIMKYLLFLFLILFILSNSGVLSVVGIRSMQIYALFSQKLRGELNPGLHEGLLGQSVDLGLVYFSQNIYNIHPANLIFGHGYGNFLTPMADILKDQFGFDVVADGKYTDTRSFVFKLFVECGIIGIIIYFSMFFYTLKLSQKLINFYKDSDRKKYYKMLVLRYAFIAFFFGDALQMSSRSFFIIMGLIVGILNNLINDGLIHVNPQKSVKK